MREIELLPDFPIREALGRELGDLELLRRQLSPASRDGECELFRPRPAALGEPAPRTAAGRGRRTSRLPHVAGHETVSCAGASAARPRRRAARERRRTATPPGRSRSRPESAFPRPRRWPGLPLRTRPAPADEAPVWPRQPAPT